MRWRNALRAEIIFRLHDAPAEILLPNAVHDYPRRQRIIRGDNPTRQIEAVRQSDRVFEGWLSLTPALSPGERFSRKISRIEPLNRSSRPEEALAISDFGFRISDFRMSLLTSAATRFIAPTHVGGYERLQTRRHAGCDPFARTREVALDEHVRFARLLLFDHDQSGHRPGLAPLELRELRVAGLELGIVGLECRVNDALLFPASLARCDLQGTTNFRLQFRRCIGRERLFPLLQRAALGVEIAIQILFDFIELLLDVVQRLEFAGDFQHAARRAFAVPVLHRVVEEGEHLVVLALCERVELVVVTLRAGEGDAEKHRRRGVHAVHHRLDAELLRVNAAFLIDLRVAMKARGDLLLQRRVRQQIARELPDGELVEAQVAVERINDPIAVFPNLPRRVNAVAVRVGVTRGVEPPTAPALPVIRRRQQPVHPSLVGVGTRVAQKLVQFRRCRRQTEQVQTQPPNQRDAVRFRRWRDAVLLQPSENKRVDGIPDPCLALDRWWRRTFRRDKRPMF